jgi:serine/threonine protein kinase
VIEPTSPVDVVSERNARIFSCWGLPVGRFEFVKLLGNGSYGSVAGARDTLLGIPVAVKRIKDGILAVFGQVERVYREIRLLRQLQHANVVQLLGIAPIA